MKKTYFFKGFLALIPVWSLTEKTAEALRFFGATVILYVLTMLFAQSIGKLKNKVLWEVLLVLWLLATVSLGHFFFDWDPRMLVSILFLLPLSLKQKDGKTSGAFDFGKKTLTETTSQASVFLAVFTFFVLIQVLFQKSYFLWMNHVGGLFVFASIGAWFYQMIQNFKAQKESLENG